MNGLFNPHTFAEGNDGELYTVRSLNGKTPQKIVPSASMAPVGEPFPTRLSETGCVLEDNPLEPAPGLIPYGVNSALWSDGAIATRWMALPDDGHLRIRDDGDIDFPVGTVLLKHFFVDASPVETRLFVHHDDGGWAGYSYEWLDDQSDAILLPAGKTKPLPNGQLWAYPNRAQCMQCHTEAAGFTLGVEHSQLNGDYLYPATGRRANQLRTLDHIGLFDRETPLPADLSALPALTMIHDQTQPLAHRVRSYLHTNCSGCHRPGGPTQSSLDVRFATAIEDVGACDQPPLHGNLGIVNEALIRPGSPEQSIMLQRMTYHEAYRMPPLGNRLVDADAVEAITNWIVSADVCTANLAPR